MSEFRDVVSALPSRGGLLRAGLLAAQYLQNGETWPNFDAALRELETEVQRRCRPTECGGTRAAAQELVSVLTARGFRGDNHDYGRPQDSLVDRVLERRRGLPVAMSMIALHLAESVEIPLVGLGFPRHFLVGVEPDSSSPFVLDVFYGESGISTDALVRLLSGAGGISMDEARASLARYMKPHEPREILSRLLENAYRAFRGADDARAVEAERLAAVVNPWHDEVQGVIQRTLPN